ncbi:cyclophilin-like fold protein [Streptomyces violarus]|uniref:cyclophilin-like fold protein n=1 Tax=Streptomyces violarus TaxID=67380 RepID=UPI0021BFF336|nr:cyclophilin-like fold protein [Streptomyces violarus]MCT9138475.1 cyclophilin-like fold protein [Streptomyces violarus]
MRSGHAGVVRTHVARTPTADSDRPRTRPTLQQDHHRDHPAHPRRPSGRRPLNDFAALLPLTLDPSDFHGTERIAGLPRGLDTSGAPDAARARAGDLAYHAPRGNPALYYRDGGSGDSGLVILGHVADGDTERLATAEHVTIEAGS